MAKKEMQEDYRVVCVKTGSGSCQEHSCFLADSGKVVCIVTCRRATLISTVVNNNMCCCSS